MDYLTFSTSFRTSSAVYWKGETPSRDIAKRKSKRFIPSISARAFLLTKMSQEQTWPIPFTFLGMWYLLSPSPALVNVVFKGRPALLSGLDPREDREGGGVKQEQGIRNYRKCQFWQYRYFALPGSGHGLHRQALQHGSCLGSTASAQARPPPRRAGGPGRISERYSPEDGV